MRLLISVYAMVIALGVVLLSINTWQQGASFGVGGLLMLANVLMLAVIWDRLLRKKLIALSLFIIVIKYALLGVVIYKTFAISWIEPLFFSLGVGSFCLAAMFYALISPSPLAEA